MQIFMFSLMDVETQEYLSLIHTSGTILSRSIHKVHAQKHMTLQVVTEIPKPCELDRPNQACDGRGADLGRIHHTGLGYLCNDLQSHMFLGMNFMYRSR